MIKPNTINKLQPSITDAVDELFNYCINHQSSPNDFLLFLGNGHLDAPVPNTRRRYLVGIGMEGIMDFDRMEFFTVYANSPFYEKYKKEKDKKNKKHIFNISLHLEMMIYTHFWEAYPLLKTWKQLTNLALGKDYDWSIDIPDFNRHEFIRKEIRDVFKSLNLKIASVITNSYHSQLRNAFAHSQYSFFFTDKIKLGNYTGKDWELKDISFDDWEKRFATTSLLYDAIMKKKHEYKKLIGPTKEKHAVWMPNGNGHKLAYLAYDSTFNRFYWYTNK